MNDSQERLVRWSNVVRQKPGMYFGTGGSAAIPVMTSTFMDSILDTAPQVYRGPIEVSVANKKQRQIISIQFVGLQSRLLSTTDSAKCLDSLLEMQAWELLAVVGASRQFALTICDGKRTLHLEIGDGVNVAAKVVRRARPPFLRIAFQPYEPVFGSLSHDGLYCVAGRLRDLSLLRPGLTTQFHADALQGGMRYYYQHGLKSQLFEEPSTPFVPFRGCLSFGASAKNMSVEGHLRFLHLGTPCVRSYANGYPVQGGAHLVGLGLALRDVFRKSDIGLCRVGLITDPLTGSRVQVPIPFIGVMALRAKDLRFGSATRDIVIGDEIKEFVRVAATEPLKMQWQALQRGACARS